MVLVIISCKDNKENELNDTINSLVSGNIELREKIAFLKDRSIVNTVMAPYFDKESYKLDKKRKSNF